MKIVGVHVQHQVCAPLDCYIMSLLTRKWLGGWALMHRHWGQFPDNCISEHVDKINAHCTLTCASVPFEPKQSSFQILFTTLSNTSFLDANLSPKVIDNFKCSCNLCERVIKLSCRGSMDQCLIKLYSPKLMNFGETPRG